MIRAMQWVVFSGKAHDGLDGYEAAAFDYFKIKINKYVEMGMSKKRMQRR